MKTSVSTRFAVIGNPIAQSKSPEIHQAFAKEYGICLDYERVLAPVDGFAETVDALRQNGVKGINVTAPFKRDAWRYATHLLPGAQQVGAANALRFLGEKTEAENFDGTGLVRDVVSNLEHPLTGKRVLILGAGGASRGILISLLYQAPKLLHIANRTLSHGQELLGLAIRHQVEGMELQALTFDACHAFYDIIFNATSSSLERVALPLPARVFAECVLAYDLSYGLGKTPFLHQAQIGGARYLSDGVGMLVEQAAEAFHWWHGLRPQTREVIAAIRVPLK